MTQQRLSPARRAVLFLAILLPAAIAAAAESAPDQFDHYVVALSWSPEHCAERGASDAQQCGPGRQFGLVLHGLWPQHPRGYPSNCSRERLPASLKSQYSGLYPNQRLFDHEWQKHGTCSGLTPRDYLALSKTLRDRINPPAILREPRQPVRIETAELRRQFLMANPGLTQDGLAIFCREGGRFLREIHICFTRQGKPGACSPENLARSRKSCSQPQMLIRNVR